MGKGWNARAAASAPARTWSGACLVAAGGCGSWFVGERLAKSPRRYLRGAVALSWVISLRELVAAGRRVRAALEAGDLQGARASLGKDLVSRDTSALAAGEVVGAAVQSLAENLNDAFVAPLFWALIGGPGAAYAYRFVNTADAVLGYRTPELHHFGWAAARTDDLLGWLPARLAAAGIVMAAPLTSASAAGAIRAIRSSAGATPSPNGGWPMAAAAGALDVRLEKRGAYVLHPRGREPRVADLRRAEGLVLSAAAVTVGLMVGMWRIAERRR